MRPKVLGLAAALFIGGAGLFGVALAPLAMSAPKEAAKVSDAERKEGMAAAPAIVQAANLPCKVSDARLIGKTAEDKKKGTPASTFVEVACQGGLGYVIQAPVGAAPTTFTCLEINGQSSGKGSVSCELPANSDPKQGLAPFIAKAGVKCTPADARGIGHNASDTYFEVACQEGTGYLLKASAPPDPGKPIEAHNCLALDQNSGNIKCTLTSEADRLKVVDTYVKASTPTCVVKDRRFVGNAQDGADIYEASCQDGKGFIYKVTNGVVAQNWDCAHAATMYGGCTLTDSRQAATEQAALYTRLAKASGSSCQVTKYALFPARANDHNEEVELVCADGASAIGIFPPTGKGEVLDCGHALVAGFKCSLGKADYSAMTADLVKYNAKSCQVSEARLAGKTPKGTLLVEVACADKLPGYMIEYSQSPVTALAATGCRFAGNCQLPTNKTAAAASK